MSDAADLLVAADVVRGVSRMLYRHDYLGVPEVPLGNGRRADIMCDRFFWAVPGGFDLGPFATPAFQPECCGLIVADRYDAAILREPLHRPLSGARRKAETLRFARRAARRLWGDLDPFPESCV